MGQDADVARAVANQREGFFGNAGEYKLALLSVGKNLSSCRVDNFSNEMIFIDMHAGLFTALKGYAGA